MFGFHKQERKECLFINYHARCFIKKILIILKLLISSQEYLIVYQNIDQCPLSIVGDFNIKANELGNT